MMKRIIAVLTAALVVSVAAFAGPTIGLGTAYFNEAFDFGVGLGLQANNVLWDFIGVEAEFSIADVYADPYDEPSVDDYSYLYGFGRANLTFAFPGTKEGPQWYFLYGVGFPTAIRWDSDNFDTDGVYIGTVFGVACELPAGHGITVLGFWEKGTLAFGAEVYVDLYGLAGKKIVEIDQTVKTAPVGEPVEQFPASGQ